MKNYIALFRKRNTRRHIASLILAILLILIGVGLFSPYYIPAQKVGKDQKFTTVSEAVDKSTVFPFEIDLLSEDVTIIDYFTYYSNTQSEKPQQAMLLLQIDENPINVLIEVSTFESLAASTATSYWVRVLPMSTADGSWYSNSMDSILKKEALTNPDEDYTAEFEEIRGNIGPRSVFLEQKAFSLNDTPTIIALISFVIGVILLINVLIKMIRHGKKLEEDIRVSSNQMSMSPAQLTELVNNDLASENILFEQKDFMFTRDWLLANDKRNVRLIPSNYIIWAYLLRTTTRTNFVVTNVSYSIILYSLTSQYPVTIVLPNEATADNVLLAIRKISPYAFIGSTDDLKKRVRKYDDFVQYWYSEKAKMEQEEALQAKTGTALPVTEDTMVENTDIQEPEQE